MDDLPTLYRDGLILARGGDLQGAATLWIRCLELSPDFCDARINLGRAWRGLGRIDEALQQFDRVLAIEPTNVEALFAKGNTLLERKANAAAIEMFDRLLRVQPRHAGAWLNRGNAQGATGDIRGALDSYQQALAIDPTPAEFHLNAGLALLDLRRDAEALAAFEQTLERQQTSFVAWTGRCKALLRLGDCRGAALAAERASQLRPANAEPHYLLGCALLQAGSADEALPHFDRALQQDPQHADAHFSRGEALQILWRIDEAIVSFSEALACKPQMPLVRGNLLHAKMLACDWTQLSDVYDALLADVRNGRLAANPFGLQAICEDESVLRQVAEMTIREFFPPLAPLHRPNRQRPTAKIRVGYLCGEFREQATAMLMTELWELHDRERFEIIAIDSGFDDASPRRRRIEKAFDALVDIAAMGDAEAAARVAALDLDILVNLNGFFGFARFGVFARRPAPIQVNYLGFPGTLGAPYIDYLIADEIVIPEDRQAHYQEKIVHLPICYQPNDRQRDIVKRPITRAEHGLPDKAFVYCCFNNTYKITPEVFEIWMTILQEVPKSVLWLLQPAESVAQKLRATAQRRGIDPARLIFAAKEATPVHLARHALADLFLDTWPYNAHTTASDALWAGLPLLTRMGHTFPARVAASLLTGLRLESLITRDALAYRRKAVELANNPAILAALRAQLSATKADFPPFDTPLLVRYLENAYESMVWRLENGLTPAAIKINMKTPLMGDSTQNISNKLRTDSI